MVLNIEVGYSDVDGNDFVFDINVSQLGDLTTSDSQSAATDMINSIVANSPDGFGRVQLIQTSTVTLPTGQSADETITIYPASGAGPGNDYTPFFDYINNPTF